jgi:sugar-phosphatase
MNRLTCDAVIFDMDGVLVDSTAVVERTWRRWAEAHGFDFGEIMRVAHGRRAVETIRIVAPHLDAEVEAARLAAEEACDTDGLVRIEGAVQLVCSLPEGRWAVATSGTQEIAMPRLAYAGVPQPAVLVAADDVERGKPGPEAYVLAAERLGVPPERRIVIEDAPTGIAAARAAGMRVVALATTFPCDELGEATVVVRRLSDIRVSIDGDRDGCITVFLGEPCAIPDRRAQRRKRRERA